jgi:hypothetical protein
MVLLAHALLTADKPGPGARSACLEARPASAARAGNRWLDSRDGRDETRLRRGQRQRPVLSEA